MNAVEIDHAKMMRVLDREHAYDMALDREIENQIDALTSEPSDYLDVTSEFYGLDDQFPIERFLLDLRRELDADHSSVYGATCGYAIKTDRVMALCSHMIDLLKSKETYIATQRAVRALESGE